MKLTDDKSIADFFNNYFSEIGNDISSKVRGTSMHFSQYLPEKTIIHSLFLEPTNESEIVSITRKLKSSFSSGIDGLTSSLVKQIMPFISMPFSHICNNSLFHPVVLFREYENK